MILVVDELAQLREITAQIAEATLKQQKIAQQLLTITMLQSQAIVELIETVEKLVTEIQKSREDTGVGGFPDLSQVSGIGV